MFKSILTALILSIVSTIVSASEFEAPYRGTEANSHVCKAAYDVLVSDEGSKYEADNLLLDFFNQDALRFLMIFTGAGSSTPSGIPAFRGAGGIWTTRQPVYYQDFMAKEYARIEYWQYKLELWEEHGDAKPNIIHQSIVRYRYRMFDTQVSNSRYRCRTFDTGIERSIPAYNPNPKPGLEG